jgi:YHYH protein
VRVVGGRAHHVLVSLAAILALAACSPGQASSAGARAARKVTEPSIWLRPSSSINPTALPLRDQHYVTDAPKQGYMYVCDPKMFQQVNGPGAQREGAWINKTTGTYDVTRKPVDSGNVYFRNAAFTITTTKTQRVISGNGLPLRVPTGIFPVQASEPAYQYDPNPNQITAQHISFSIPRHPTLASAASCTYKQIGITLDGVQVHAPLDSSGRDELAYQTQDVCTGVPQPGGAYHRFSLSECTPHIHERNALVGYALDGFGIFSPYDQNGKELTSADLDACHGKTSKILWEGKTVSMYHYVMTRDFPNTVACFRGTPTRNAFPTLPGAPPQH